MMLVAWLCSLCDKHPGRYVRPIYTRLQWPLRWTIMHSKWMVPLLQNRNDVLAFGCKASWHITDFSAAHFLTKVRRSKLS